MSDYLERELARARAQTDAAMRASGNTDPDARLEAGLRASLDYALKDMPRDHMKLIAALGGDEEVDAGSFLLGMQVAAFTIQRLDAVECIRLNRDLFREYVAKARERVK